MTGLKSSVWTHIDYERNGKQVGTLNVPHSVHRSAYGVIPMPLCVIRNGTGPTALYMAGNHGDEYEGQIALLRLIRSVDPGAVQGRLIILPALNFPAVRAGRRVSPLDQANLNRAFPGDPLGGPTAKIAHYLSSVLYPMCDFMHDFHAGGSSLNYLPFASLRLCGDADVDGRGEACLRAFAPPMAMIWRYTNEKNSAATCASGQGLVNLAGEFGGAGTLSLPNTALIEAGIRRVLDHLGILDAAPEHAVSGPPTRYVEVRGPEYYVYAPTGGIFEPFVALGDTVTEGQPAGQVHCIDDPLRPPEICHFLTAGKVICERPAALVEKGDCVFHLAMEAPDR